MRFYDPVFENPYPQHAWSEITEFKYDSPIWLFRAEEALHRPGHRDPDYLVGRPYTISYRLDGVERTITVPQGMVTDLASVPRWAWWIVGRVGRHLEASIVHDFLYIAWQDLAGYAARREDRKFADALMRAGLDEANVHVVEKLAIRLALWIAGWSVYRDPNPKPRYVELPAPPVATPVHPAPPSVETTPAV